MEQMLVNRALLPPHLYLVVTLLVSLSEALSLVYYQSGQDETRGEGRLGVESSSVIRPTVELGHLAEDVHSVIIDTKISGKRGFDPRGLWVMSLACLQPRHVLAGSLGNRRACPTYLLPHSRICLCVSLGGRPRPRWHST